MCETLYEKLVKPFEPFFESAWLTGTMIEDKVKDYLDYIGTLMIRRPDKHNVLSPVKQTGIKKMEVSIISLDHLPQRITPADKKILRKKAKRKTRMERMNKIKKAHPDGEISFCNVDTENHFTYRGIEYVINQAATAYRGIETKEGTFYPITKIMVVSTGKDLSFFDENLDRVDKSMISAAE